MASPVILTVTSGFGMGGDTFALAVLLAFIMMQAQVTEAATLIPPPVRCTDYISCGMGRFAITGALCAYLIVHIFAGTARRSGGHYGAGELRVD